MADQIPPTLLDAYLAGELSPDDAARVRAYLDEHPGRRGIVAGILASARSDTAEAMPPLETSLAELLARLESAERSVAASFSRSARSNRVTDTQRRAGWGYGLTAVLLIGGLFAIGGTWLARTPSHAPLARAHYATREGQTARVQLPNQTRVLLGPATTIDVAGNDIRMTGEAKFDVTPSVARAVRVRTANAVVSVLGTSFTVRQYADEPASRVVVLEGKVGLEGARGSTRRAVLTARMMGQVSDSLVTAMLDSSADDLTAWTQGRLVFHDVRLGVVVTDLARAYGTTIQLTDSVLARQPVTVTAQPSNHALSQVLELITRATGAHYVRVGNGFAIEPGRTSLNMPRSRRVTGPEKSYGR